MARRSFIMVSAYVDSGFALSTRFSKGELVVLITYLEMIWILDPLVYAMCSSEWGVPEVCYEDSDGAMHNEYVGVHRWYLLLMLLLKAILATFRVLKVPPFAQCAVVTIVAFTAPSEFACLTDKACSTSADTKAWLELRPAMQPLLGLLFMGAYEDAWNMYSSIFMRYYLLFAVQYVWTFHYGRLALAWLARKLVRVSKPASALKRKLSARLAAATAAAVSAFGAGAGSFRLSGREDEPAAEPLTPSGRASSGERACNEPDGGAQASETELQVSSRTSDGAVSPHLQRSSPRTLRGGQPATSSSSGRVGALGTGRPRRSDRLSSAQFAALVVPVASAVGLVAVELYNAGSVGPRL